MPHLRASWFHTLSTALISLLSLATYSTYRCSSWKEGKPLLSNPEIEAAGEEEVRTRNHTLLSLHKFIKCFFFLSLFLSSPFLTSPSFLFLKNHNLQARSLHVRIRTQSFQNSPMDWYQYLCPPLSSTRTSLQLYHSAPVLEMAYRCN